MNVLVLNCGSSSAKFAVINPESGQEHISGIAQRLGSPHASLDWKVDGQKHSKVLHQADHDAALRVVVDLLKELGLADALVAVGHRVVHGGARFSVSTRSTSEVVDKMRECSPPGQLHHRPKLTGMQIAWAM